MTNRTHSPMIWITCAAATTLAASAVTAAPTVTRLTPPSELFSNGRAAPIIARFLQGQRFDLQATVRPDDEAKSITNARFSIDGNPLGVDVSIKACATICKKDIPANVAIVTSRAVSVSRPGVHKFTVAATQSDGQSVVAEGNFEVVPFAAGGQRIKNVIILLGDGMGGAQRTAARIVAGGYSQGKVIAPLTMDTFPVTGLIKTASLNSVITDSSPGMTAYVSGNKNNNNEEGVFPDDTLSSFDNPRVEYLSEYLHRTRGKALGIVTTADVFDATPAGNAVHTSNRGDGTGIVDQFFDDRRLSGLSVLMGGGRKWFIPATTPGSARTDKSDYAFLATEAHTADIVKRWGASPGTFDADRNLIAEFQAAGFAYAGDKTGMEAIDPRKTTQLLGLFSHSNMNVALDKINGRRAREQGANADNKSRVVDDYGFPDQPMLDEMTTKALSVLDKNRKGFVLMVEGASIDKQAHAMDTERWMLDTIEFDRAIAVVKSYAAQRKDTLVIVTADHECAGVALIGGSMVSDAKLQELVRDGGVDLRDKTVGIYERAGFPKYRIASDGYPETTDIDNRLLIGYGANADRYEDYRTNPLPLQDSQQPFVKTQPLAAYPADPTKRDADGRLMITGQVPGNSAVHTASDVPLSAFGPGAYAFTGTLDNTDVFFKIAQTIVQGVVPPLVMQAPKKR